MFRVFLKKEVYDFLAGKLFILVTTLFLCYPVCLSFLAAENTIRLVFIKENILFYLLFPEILFCCLYICDSCTRDFQTGGMLFSVNMKAPVFLMLSAKSAVILCMGIMFSVMNILCFPIYCSIQNMSLFLLIVLSCTVMSYTISFFVLGTDIISFSVIILVSSLQIAIFQSKMVLPMRIVAPVVQLVLFILFLKPLYQSRRFRLKL